MALPQVLRRFVSMSLNLFIFFMNASSFVSLFDVAYLVYQVIVTIQHEMRALPLSTGAAFVFFAFLMPVSFFPAAWFAFALQSTEYLAETFRGGIEAIPRGQREAAYSVGMSPLLVFRRIVLPQVSLSTAPSLVNQFTVIVKSSTLVSVITVQDLMFQSQKIVNIWYEPIEILTATAAIYIAIVFLVSTAGKALADTLRRRYGIALE